MVDKEMLDAMRSLIESEREYMSQMIDQKLEQKLEEKFEQKLEPINARLDTIEDNQASMLKDITYLMHTIEPKLNIIHENLSGITERSRRQDATEEKVEEHGIRISALEKAVGEHLKAI